MQTFKLITLSFLFTVSLVTSAFSQDVTLSWDASPSPGVTGYKVYYKSGNMSFPFDGTTADQGVSPVDVGDTLSTTLTGLTDGVTYYFTVTAYDGSDNQSTYSNIVSNSWIPELLAPANNAINEPVPVTFQWETAPSGYNVSYTLFYGTNQSEVNAAKSAQPVAGIPADQGTPPVNRMLLLIALLGTVLLLSQLRWKRLPRPLMLGMVVLIGGMVTACGGGGGGGDGTTDRSAATSPAPVDSVLYSIDKGSSDYHQAFDLLAGTTYFWKVVATDTNDPNLTYESPVQSFTTETF